MLKNKAVQKPSIPKPVTSLEHNIIIAAFITNRNNPSVIKVTGKVKRTRIGFTNKFSSPKTIATTTEVIKPSTVTPGIKFAISITKIAVTRSLTIKPISFCFYSLKYKKFDRNIISHKALILYF